MFRFKSPQRIVEIGGVKIGGNPSERPPALIGTIFYHGHKIILDEHKGEFDRGKAERLIRDVEESSEKTKIPAIIDVMGSTPDAIIKYLEFIASVTDLPIAIDSPSVDVTKAALSYVKNSGLAGRVVYNSLRMESTNCEYQALKDAQVKSAMALLYTSKILSIDARINALKAIVSKARTFGVENILVDTFVIDVSSLAIAMRTILTIKSQHGYPCGCAAPNAISVQRKAFKKKFGKKGTDAVELAVNIAPAILGSDFLLYGPIEKTKEIFPAAYIIHASYKSMLMMKTPLIELS